MPRHQAIGVITSAFLCFVLAFVVPAAPASAQVTVGSNGADTIDNTRYTGSQTLTKTGSNRVTLTNASPISGAVTVNAGTLAITGSGQIRTGYGWLAHSVVVNPGATLEVDRWWGAGSLGESDYNAQWFQLNGATLRYSGTTEPLSGSRGFTVGASGATFEAASVGQVWDVARSGLGAYQSVFNGSVTLAGAGDGVMGQFITGANSVTKTGTGTWTLAGSNSYTGATTLAAGRLVLGNASALANTGTIAFTGGTLRYGPGITTDLSSRIRNSTASISIDTGTSAVTFASAIGASNSGGLAKSGSGSLTLSGSNSYTGDTTLAAGRLNINHARALGSGTFTIHGGTIANTSTAAIVLATNNPQVWNGDLTFSGTRNLDLGTGPVTLTADRQVATDSATLSVGGLFAGAFGLTKTGSGTLVLSGSSSFTGNTTLGGGILALGDANALSASGTLAFAGGTLQYRAGTAGVISSQITSGTAGIKIDSAAAGVAIDSAIGASNTGGLTKSGTGSLTLSQSNGYSGQTSVNGGRLILSASTGPALYAGTSGTLAINGGGTASFARAGQLGANVDVVLDSNAGSSVLQLNGANQTIGNIFVGPHPAGLGQFGRDNSQHAYIENGGAGDAVLTIVQTASASMMAYGGYGPGLYGFNGQIRDRAPGSTSTGKLSLVKQGPELLRLSGTGYSFTGSITIQSGTLEFLDTRSGSGEFTRRLAERGPIYVENGSTLQFAAGYQVYGNLFQFGSSGGGLVQHDSLAYTRGFGLVEETIVKTTGGATNTFSGDWRLTEWGPTAGGAPAWADWQSPRSLTFDVTRGTDATSDLTVSSSLGTYGSNVHGRMTIAVEKKGNGILLMTGSSSYSKTTLVSGGVLNFGSSGTSNTFGSVAGDVSLAAGTRLGGVGTIGGAITGAGLVSPGNSPGILTSGSIDPSGGLDFTFEFSGMAPNYANAAASVNDVLRITGSTPFTAALTSANTKTLFLNMTEAELAVGTILKGGFFTDLATDFTALLNNQAGNNAGFQVYVLGNGLGTDNSLNGQGYYNWRNPAMFGWTQSLFLSTTAESADFGSGSINGQLMTLTVGVPEPSSIALAGVGTCLAGLIGWRRRRTKKTST